MIERDISPFCDSSSPMTNILIEELLAHFLRLCFHTVLVCFVLSVLFCFYVRFLFTRRT